MADEPIDDDDIDPDEELAKSPARPGRKARAQMPPERLLWQDREFRPRAQRRARELGKQMVDVLRRCGLGEDYVYRAAFWRDTNAVMCLAEELHLLA